MARCGVNAPGKPMSDAFAGAPLANAAAWDAYVAAHPDATPFHTRAWCEAITKATGHRCHLVTARDAHSALTGLVPLHHVRSPLFGQALVGSGFAVDGGLLADDAAVAATLAKGAADLARALGVPSVELRGGPLPAGEGWRCEGDVYAGFTRDLAADDEAELLAVPRKQRAEVRKALAGDLSVTTGRDAAERRDHYRIYATSVRNLGTPVFPKALFDAVLDAFGEDADILTVRVDGRPVVVLQATNIAYMNNAANLIAQWMRQAGFNVSLQASDWGAVVTRRAVKAAPDQGGWNVFFTSGSVNAFGNPVSLSGHAANGEKGWFGWPTNEKHEQLRDKWAGASSDAERKQIARDIQQNAWDFVPHMYYGQWFQPAALRKLTGLIGMPEVIPFWNVRKG